MYLPPHQRGSSGEERKRNRDSQQTVADFNPKMLGTKDMCVTPPTCCNDGVHKQCDSSHCREVDVQHGVASQHGSTQAV